eukprot:GHVQ01010277.1.p1 GENE.GHVQ01010277.1~~GHVQ01010277.1.p1  ORF type:complete len:313 (+),score=33.29 GHVQ01010277.1:86-1024(+)
MSPSHQAKRRKASHAGSWYASDGVLLAQQLSDLIAQVQGTPHTNNSLKALICPHAGYAYCGTTAAWSWRQIDASKINRVVALGPSHHVYLTSCSLPAPSVRHYETPLGDVRLDHTGLEAMRCTGEFEEMSIADDQNEHSIELQLPFLRHVMKDADFVLLPIIVGHLSNKQLGTYGELLLPYFKDQNTLFVISSDFCHWGKRFRYTYVMPDCENIPVYKAIETLDMQGIYLIEKQDSAGFEAYLHKHGNTICGQNPIRVLLHLLNSAGRSNYSSTLLHYSQSCQATEHRESSVSYAAMSISSIANSSGTSITR